MDTIGNKIECTGRTDAEIVREIKKQLAAAEVLGFTAKVKAYRTWEEKGSRAKYGGELIWCDYGSDLTIKGRTMYVEADDEVIPATPHRDLDDTTKAYVVVELRRERRYQ